jgi:hypothetical protein
LFNLVPNFFEFFFQVWYLCIGAAFPRSLEHGFIEKVSRCPIGVQKSPVPHHSTWFNLESTKILQGTTWGVEILYERVAGAGFEPAAFRL